MVIVPDPRHKGQPLFPEAAVPAAPAGARRSPSSGRTAIRTQSACQAVPRPVSSWPD